VKRAYYSATVEDFVAASADAILGQIARNNEFDLTPPQRDAWLGQTAVLQRVLRPYAGSIYLEFTIPRMGRRIDAVVIIGALLFVVEFKVESRLFQASDLDQVVDYALDLHNFHEGSHRAYIAPILVCTAAPTEDQYFADTVPSDGLFAPSKTNAEGLGKAVSGLLQLVRSNAIDIGAWEISGYKPTPTIIEATLALYRGHSVAGIARSDAGAMNLTRTSTTVAHIIEASRSHSQKAICFVTGVPGAGKTLVGLDAATKHIDHEDELYSVFLSGNGPLVAILQEALARDEVQRSREQGRSVRKGEALSTVKAFIQNVHHFRDDCLKSERPPVEHVAIFDEAQRAWTLKETADFMRRKKGISDFVQSEPQFLISCLDRHPDWAVVICLVGGGQEINRGEAGIREWLDALSRFFPQWRIYVSDRLTDSEYAAGTVVEELRGQPHVEFKPELHLATSMRSFRSENVSRFVKDVLDLESDAASKIFTELKDRYPIFLTRDLHAARGWVRHTARGSERYGIVVSSSAERLKPHAVDVKTPVDPGKWFLNDKRDVRSSYYLEDVATEFHVQGLELDWTCVVWDADFRHAETEWSHWSFRGNRWERIRADERRHYLRNAYRVLLTRARQGMVIVVPAGDRDDPTRLPEFYDPTFRYLERIGLPPLPLLGITQAIHRPSH
jgi:hypothetical protein